MLRSTSKKIYIASLASMLLLGGCLDTADSDAFVEVAGLAISNAALLGSKIKFEDGDVIEFADTYQFKYKLDGVSGSGSWSATGSAVNIFLNEAYQGSSSWSINESYIYTGNYLNVVASNGASVGGFITKLLVSDSSTAHPDYKQPTTQTTPTTSTPTSTGDNTSSNTSDSYNFVFIFNKYPQDACNNVAVAYQSYAEWDADWYSNQSKSCSEFSTSNCTVYNTGATGYSGTNGSCVIRYN